MNAINSQSELFEQGKQPHSPVLPNARVAPQLDRESDRVSNEQFIISVSALAVMFGLAIYLAYRYLL